MTDHNVKEVTPEVLAAMIRQSVDELNNYLEKAHAIGMHVKIGDGYHPPPYGKNLDHHRIEVSMFKML